MKQNYLQPNLRVYELQVKSPLAGSTSGTDGHNGSNNETYGAVVTTGWF